MQVKLSDADLNTFLAENLLGWERLQSNSPVNRTRFDAPKYYYQGPQGALFIDLDFPATYHWNPTQDRNQLQLCLEKLQDNGFHLEFISIFRQLIEGKPPGERFPLRYKDAFELLTASSRVIVEAIYLTLEGESHD